MILKRILTQKTIRDNFIAASLYIVGAFVSYIISLPTFYFSPLWIPFGFMVGYSFFKGKSVIPGFSVTSLIVHVLLTNWVFGSDYFSWIDGFLMAFSELILLYTFIWLRDKSRWNEVVIRKGNEVNGFILFSLIIPIPIVLTQLFVLSKHLDYSLVEIVLQTYLSTSLSLIVFATLFLTFYRRPTEKPFESKRRLLEFVLLITVYILIIFDNTFLNIFGGSYTSLIYIIVIPSVIFISIRYSYRVFSLTISILSILFLFTTWKFANIDSNVSEIFPVLNQNILFLLITSILSLYIKENYMARANAIESLKVEYNYIDDEINRQIVEYKKLNDQLFVEIERRGIAERELEKNRKLLSDAQAIGKISTWEYNFDQNRFRWISPMDVHLLSDIESDGITLIKLSKILHPEDLKKVKSKIDSILKGKRDINIEVRLRKSDNSFGYFLVRGRGFTENGKLSRVLGLIMDISEQKAAEQAIKDKELKYQALFDSNIDPISLIDADTLEVIDINPAFEQTYGYSRAELIGKPYTIFSAQPDETKTAITFAAQKGYYRVTNRIHKKKSGEEFHVEGSLITHVVEGKRVMFIISQDVSRRRAIESSLAEREQKYRTFFESDLVGMAELSITRDWISVNEKMSRILGYSAKELKHLTWDQITHPDDLATETRLFNQLLTHETDGYSIEKRFISKNSKVVICQVIVRSVRSMLGNITHMIQLIEDITERKQAEQELIESRAKLSQAQSVAKLGIIRFIVGSNEIILSDEAYEILGFGNKRPRLTRRDFFKTILQGSQTRFDEHICNLENGIPVEGSQEQSILASNGDVKYILSNFGTTRDVNEKVVEVVATLADITRIKQAEMALQEANVLKDQIFSIIGHDLRSPIGSIHQLIDLYITSKEDLDEETSKSILDSLHTTSDETFKLLESLLDWAKEQRTVTFKPVKTDLIGLVNQVISFSKGVAESKGISIQSNLSGKAFSLVDNEMIKTVLRNLISNSIKFTPHGGVIMVGISDDNEKYRVSISDTGKGIPAEALGKLFDNSSTYSTLGTNNEKGTGLGLKLVKNFVEKNGGNITVESVQGQGSVFTFSVPKFNDRD